MFYHEVPESITCPPTPEWKRPSDLDLNGEAKEDDDDDNGEPAPSPVGVSSSTCLDNSLLMPPRST